MAGFWGASGGQERAAGPDPSYFLDMPENGRAVRLEAGDFLALHYIWSNGKAKCGLSGDGTVLAGYAGYIQNLAALAKEHLPERERAGSTAVLADLYAVFGNLLWPALNGNFAAFAFDPARRTVTLASDRLGTFPLYYSQAEGGIAFSTSMLALASTRPFRPRLDLQAAVEYLSFSYPLRDRTLCREISLLSPASFLTARDGSVRVESYWKPSFSTFGRKDGLLEAYSSALDDAIDRACDGGSGLALSAGLDSRQIAARSSGRLRVAVVHGSPGSRDAGGARMVSQQIGVPLLTVTYEPEEFGRLCAESIIANDGLANTPEFLLMARRLSHACNVEIVGAYGDRLRGIVGGEQGWRYKDLETARRSICSNANREFIPFSEAMRCYGPAVTGELVRAARESFISSFDEYASFGPFNAALMQDTAQRQRRRVFPALGVGRRCMEVRFPLTDNRLVDFAFSVPWELKARGDIYRKSFLRDFPALASIPNSMGMSFAAEERYGWTRRVKKAAFYAFPSFCQPTLSRLIRRFPSVSSNATAYDSALKKEMQEALVLLADSRILGGDFARKISRERGSGRYVLLHRLFTLASLIGGVGIWKGMTVRG